METQKLTVARNFAATLIEGHDTVYLPITEIHKRRSLKPVPGIPT